MTSLCIRWLIAIVVGLPLFSEGSLEFTREPSATVYIPPDGFPGKYVICATNEPASIVWRYHVAPEIELDSMTYNITVLSPKSSGLFLTSQLSLTAPGRFILHAIRCEVGNVTSRDFRFIPGVVPSVENHPEKNTVNEGASVDFSCSFNRLAAPQPNVTWRFSSNSGNETLREGVIPSGTLRSVLELKDINRTDEGNYSCIVKNEFRSVESSPALLTVHYFGPITIKDSPRLTIKEGVMGIIDCKVEAVPTPTELVLSRNDIPFLSSSNMALNGKGLGTFTVRTPHNLKFEFTAAPEWNGTVTCSGSNSAGNAESALIIIFQTPPAPPKLCVNETKPSTHSIIYSFQLGNNGQSPITEVLVLCYKVKDDNELDISSEFKQNATKFNSRNCNIDEVFGLIPGTKYGCQLQAKNDVGSSNLTDRFDGTTIDAEPAKPILNPIAVETKEISLKVKWTVEYNGGKPIEEYIVYWGTDSNSLGSKKVIENPASQTQGMHSITGLQEGTMYFVQIEAKNSVGSNKSEATSYRTRSCVPPKPIIVTSTTERLDATYTMIKLVMVLPAEGTLCSPVVDYVVEDSTTGEIFSFGHIINDNVVTITVSGLKEGTETQLTVSFKNAYGNVGPASVPVKVTTEESKFTISTRGHISFIVLSLQVSSLLNQLSKTVQRNFC
jgi:hypothetical protein